MRKNLVKDKGIYVEFAIIYDMPALPCKDVTWEKLFSCLIGLAYIKPRHTSKQFADCILDIDLDALVHFFAVAVMSSVIALDQVLFWLITAGVSLVTFAT